jgi:carbon storage regulator CsrA
MLVLTLHVGGEGVVIDERTTVRVGRVSGQKVRLVFDAPRDVPIHRESLLAKLVRQGRRLLSDPVRLAPS